jgi:hypothetical protein
MPEVRARIQMRVGLVESQRHDRLPEMRGNSSSNPAPHWLSRVMMKAGLTAHVLGLDEIMNLIWWIAMKFDLWFPKPMAGPNDKDAETAFIAGQSAYIELIDPFDDGSGQHSLVKSKGRILLCHEAITADECCHQIDSLIEDLKKLKIKARRKFER